MPTLHSHTLPSRTSRHASQNLAKELKSYYSLDDYQTIDLALKAERNEILSRAFVLTDSDRVPTALEKLVHTIEEK